MRISGYGTNANLQTNTAQRKQTPAFGSTLNITLSREAGDTLARVFESVHTEKAGFLTHFAEFLNNLKQHFANDGKNHTGRFYINELSVLDGGKGTTLRGTYELSTSCGKKDNNAIFIEANRGLIYEDGKDYPVYDIPKFKQDKLIDMHNQMVENIESLPHRETDANAMETLKEMVLPPPGTEWQ